MRRPPGAPSVRRAAMPARSPRSRGSPITFISAPPTVGSTNPGIAAQPGAGSPSWIHLMTWFSTTSSWTPPIMPSCMWRRGKWAAPAAGYGSAGMGARAGASTRACTASRFAPWRRRLPTQKRLSLEPAKGSFAAAMPASHGRRSARRRATRSMTWSRWQLIR